jgi:hypothetical protein
MLGGHFLHIHTRHVSRSGERLRAFALMQSVSASSCFLIYRYVLGNTFDADGKELRCTMTWGGRGASVHVWLTSISLSLSCY